MKRKSTLAVISIAMSLSMASTSFAGEWQWIDGNGDGIAECYYMENGTALTNATTPDGYQVDGTGAWIVDGVVQTQGTGQVSNGVNHSENYDPAHPLANAPEAWNLKLTPDKNFLNYHYICNDDNIHALLTGQIEYYHERTGYGSEEQKTTEQALYQWFCNWLNNMDFEHMSEMEKAKEIQKVLQSKSYDTQYANSSHAKRNSQHAVLIDGKGICIEYAETATALAEAVGLKTCYVGDMEHVNYIIQVDGTAYLGSNNLFNLVTKAEYSGYTAFNWFN